MFTRLKKLFSINKESNKTHHIDYIKAKMNYSMIR